MKKLLFISLFSLFLFTSIANAVDTPAQTSVCGKSYMLIVSSELYVIDFPNSPIAPDCYGTMTFYWGNQSKQYAFITTDSVFIDITNFGLFALRGSSLYYITPSVSILKEF